MQETTRRARSSEALHPRLVPLPGTRTRRNRARSSCRASRPRPSNAGHGRPEPRLVGGPRSDSGAAGMTSISQGHRQGGPIRNPSARSAASTSGASRPPRRSSVPQVEGTEYAVHDRPRRVGDPDGRFTQTSLPHLRCGPPPRDLDGPVKTSTSFIAGTGLKKYMPDTFGVPAPAKYQRRRAVLEASTVSGPTTPSLRGRRDLLRDPDPRPPPR